MKFVVIVVIVVVALFIVVLAQRHRRGPGTDGGDGISTTYTGDWSVGGD